MASASAIKAGSASCPGKSTLDTIATVKHTKYDPLARDEGAIGFVSLAMTSHGAMGNEFVAAIDGLVEDLEAKLLVDELSKTTRGEEVLEATNELVNNFLSGVDNDLQLIEQDDTSAG